MSDQRQLAREQVIIALDVPNVEQAEILLSHWNNEEKPWIKVGYQLFYQVGPQWVYQRKQEGYSIFLDLKLHDIPTTVEKGVQSLCRLGVDLLTIHAAGGREMIRRAREATEQISTSQRMKILAVTQLTSTDQAMLQDLGIQESVTDSVERYAKLAYTSGADGVICSGLEAHRIKQVTDAGFLTVTPGIRPLGSDAGDQKRIVTPSQAVLGGADYLVIGRPITQSENPLNAYEQILAEIINAKGKLV